MSRPRTLWTGPCGAPLLEAAMAAAGPSTFWVVPTPFAREQLLRRLAARHLCMVRPHVWCWEDLWAAVREGSTAGPARLSEAGSRAALRQAIAGAQSAGELPTIGEVVGLPGFRRRLRGRLAGWTRIERPASARPPGDDPIVADEWAIFVRYRAILGRLDGEDAAGFASWASRVFCDRPPSGLKRLNSVVFVEPLELSPACARVLDACQARSEVMGVTLPFVDDPGQAEVFATTRKLWERLRGWQFREVRVESDLWRPKGLKDLGAALFREDAPAADPLGGTDRVKVVGAPQGEGCALVIAREVRERLERGAEPDDVVILFRRWDEQAEVLDETLRAWGLPVSAVVERPLAAAPALSALRLAIGLPLADWETGSLVRLLRNARCRPAWEGFSGDPLAGARAAAAVQATRVFRGLDALRNALGRAVAEPKTKGPKLERVRLALDLLGRLGGLISALDRPAPWAEQASKLRHLAAELRLGDPGESSLDALYEAVEDHGMILEGLGLAGRALSWAEFVAEVEGLIADLKVPAAPPRAGTIRIMGVDDAEGGRAAHVVLADLAEGSFPSREAVEADLARSGVPAEEGSEAAPEAYGREMLRFLRVIGAAETDLVLAYPTTDAKGQELLMAGFLDDLLRLYADGARAEIHESHRRFHPAILDRDELAGSPRDRRVQALALACVNHDPSTLAALAGSAEHRGVLEGTADALLLEHARSQTPEFGRYDGKLSDARAALRLRGSFGPEEPLSPSQLESFLYCPFQFFARYVLRLAPVDERDELEEDYAERGSRIHRLLEELERRRLQELKPRDDLAEEVIVNELRSEPELDASLSSGLRLIERGRLERAIRRYARQHEAYERSGGGEPPRPHLFEVDFGPDAAYPSLKLGEGDAAVTLQGKIDRIDLVASSGGPRFRVIDYKTGSRPPTADVRAALWLQLPLYALAVERMVLADVEAVSLLDFGYWCLRDEGYKALTPKGWDEARESLERYVLEQVELLRQGVFAVSPRRANCSDHCEYSTVCRIRQVRSARKTRSDLPILELRL